MRRLTHLTLCNIFPRSQIIPSPANNLPVHVPISRHSAHLCRGPNPNSCLCLSGGPPTNPSPGLCACVVIRYWPCQSGWRKPGTRWAAPGWCPWRLASRSGSRFHWWCGRWWWVAAPSPRGCAAEKKKETRKAEEVKGRDGQRKSLRGICFRWALASGCCEQTCTEDKFYCVRKMQKSLTFNSLKWKLML